MKHQRRSAKPSGDNRGYVSQLFVRILMQLKRKFDKHPSDANDGDTNAGALVKATRGMGFATWFIAGAAVLNFGVALLTWQALTGQQDVMRKQLDAALAESRPWVGGGETDTQPLKQGQPLVASVIIKNFGHTAALNIVGGFGNNLLDSSVDPTPLGRCDKCAADNLLPGGSKEFQPFLGTTTLSDAEFDGIEKGTLRLWILGRLDYSDQTGASHHTTICMYARINPNGTLAFSPGGPPRICNVAT